MKRWKLSIPILIILTYLLYLLLTSQRDKSLAFDEGMVAFKKGNYTEAIKRLRPFAKKNNTTAQYQIGLMYAYGLGIDRNIEIAKKLLLASRKNPAEDFYQIAKNFDKGNRVIENDKVAIDWYTIAGENGHKQSQYILSQAYKEGRYGLLPDQLKAEYWSRLSLEK